MLFYHLELVVEDTSRKHSPEYREHLFFRDLEKAERMGKDFLNGSEYILKEFVDDEDITGLIPVEFRITTAHFEDWRVL